jgi:GNAT superfamily N-acetyltransferase
MAALINAIIERGGTTAFRTPFDAAKIRATFIAPPLGIACTVAADGPALLGFQALEWCDPDWPGEDRLPADWAVVATYVAPGRQGRGVGRALFAVTREAARRAEVRAIDATIRRENAGGLAYYGAMGFVPYREASDAVSKRFDPAAAA